jgi:hypothetical protein
MPTSVLLFQQLIGYRREVFMHQYEAVIQAMEQLGGFAPLGQLYQQTMKVPGATSFRGQSN